MNAKRRVKERLYARYKENRCEDVWEEYKIVRNEYLRAVRRNKREHERMQASKVSKDSKGFFRYFGMKAKSKVGPLEVNERVVENDVEVAECLNDYFSSVFTCEDLTNMPDSCVNDDENMISDIDVTVDEVMNEMNRLKVDKSPGPDEILARVLKKGRLV